MDYNYNRAEDAGYRYYNYNRADIRRKRISRKRRRRRRIRALIVTVIETAVIIISLYYNFSKLLNDEDSVEKAIAEDAIVEEEPAEIVSDIDIPDWIDVQYIDEGNPSRTGESLEGVNDIVIHYVGNPGTTAQQNKNFYNQEDSVVCSHFVVGIDGEVIMCLPLNEKSEASNNRNRDSISVEVCHPDESGKFTDASYKSLIRLVDWLMDEFDLDTDHVIRHYEVTGKKCPLYYVDHPEAWEQFKRDL